MPGIGGTFLAGFIGNCKVGENSLGGKSRQKACFADSLHTVFKIIPVTQEAKPGHTGVYLDMHLQGALTADGFLTILIRLCLTGNSLSDIIFDKLADLFLRRMSQNQDWHGDSVMAKLHSLVNAADSQIIRAEILQKPADLYGAVTVGIRLYNAQKFHICADSLSQNSIIMGEGIQINFCPGPL